MIKHISTKHYYKSNPYHAITSCTIKLNKYLLLTREIGKEIRESFGILSTIKRVMTHFWCWAGVRTEALWRWAVSRVEWQGRGWGLGVRNLVTRGSWSSVFRHPGNVSLDHAAPLAWQYSNKEFEWQKNHIRLIITVNPK